MYTITRHATPVDTSTCSAVLDLVEENVTALSMSSPPITHPLFDGYKTMLVEEVRIYMTRRDLPQIELLTASTDDGRIVGFLLFALVQNDVQECNIYYSAVQKKYRRHGIMNNMMQVILGISPSIGLSCDIVMVPIYKRFGFRVVTGRETQVVMFIGNPTGITPVIDPTDLGKLEVVDTAFSRAIQRSNMNDIRRADRTMKADLMARKVKVRNFVKVNG
ncbi:GNAT family N-acetyltransferase [Pseudomonas sp. TNT3]|uniref:GNAT family N-acetyltransferase n=1 Tax=Pseudomonas sp. TNT3 TaxID=2654097 RepID=UPI001390F49D|nr:GNAT family N-acetyltransferase [Pseudomonas sp. TNT3]KAI2687464.1 GNAT family N-acetyltransferase [Pseudomonas sp. TNT3]